MPEQDVTNSPVRCRCTYHSEDRGGGYSELVIEPEPSCPEHGRDLVALPSSTVDEDALMAELDRHNPRYDFNRQVSNCACGWKFKNHVEGAHSVHRARAVAEWLKEQGR